MGSLGKTLEDRYVSESIESILDTLKTVKPDSENILTAKNISFYLSENLSLVQKYDDITFKDLRRRNQTLYAVTMSSISMFVYNFMYGY